jgi:hypothetical protein
MDVSKLDIVYISYDEPRADEFFEDLKQKSPRTPLRVHGVKGFDAAHKAAAKLATTSRFITVDGDNIVRESFFKTKLKLQSDYVYSFTAYNITNGLAYGNGGIKIWPKELVLSVDTHENGKGNDFCWTYRYWQINDIASDVYINQSQYIAFRSGFREAVKLSLIKDKRLPWLDTLDKIYPPNLSRLIVWMTVGADVENGGWSILGAKAGFKYVQDGGDLDKIRDYDWFLENWLKFPYEVKRYALKINNELIETVLPELSPMQSQWFKLVFKNEERHGPMIPDMEPLISKGIS